MYPPPNYYQHYYAAHFNSKPPKITPPETICKKCEKRYDAHDKRQKDQNGWVEVEKVTIEIPRDWPYYKASDYIK